MKTFTASFFAAAWLYTSALCDEHAHAGVHRRQQLSDILDKLGVLPPNVNFDAVKQLTQSVEDGSAGGASGKGGVLTVTVDDIFGTKLPQAASTPPNQGAIWVSLSSRTSERLSAPTNVAGGNESAANPALGEPMATTIQSTISLTTTVTAESSATTPSSPAHTSAPAAALPPVPIGQPGAGSLPPIVIHPTGALPTQPNAAVPAHSTTVPLKSPPAAVPLQGTAGTLPPIVQKPSPVPAAGAPLPQAPPPRQASGGALPPILQPTNVPPGVFPPGSVPRPTAPSPVQSGAMAIGTGTVINGQCACACACPTNAFPPQVAAPPLPPSLPAPQNPSAPPAPPGSSATTLQTIILPSSVLSPLPTSLLIDTRLPPAVSTSVPIIPPPAQVTQPGPSLLPSSTLPIVPPPQKALDPPGTTIQLGLNPLPPAPTPPPLPTVAPTINISTFSLVSSLVLALGGP